MTTRRLKKKNWPKILLFTALGLAIAIGAAAYSIYNTVQETVNQTYEPLKRDKSDKRTAFTETEPISILLLGVDEREGDRGRSDSLILLTIDPIEKSSKMVSIPRDTRTEIIGKGIEDKINHAYAFGGVDMTIDTVEHLLDIPVDYYVQVNMESFQDIVDAVGGITVDNKFAFSYGGVDFPKGTITLNGEEALKYSRMRYDDPRGDFGRQDRQRQIIQAVIKEGASFSTLANYKNILNSISKNIKTNLTFKEMQYIQANYKDSVHNLKQVQINGTGTKMNGIYYYIVSEQERDMISNTLK
ncbi:polyisoprenyl-teichoic acid--peptidoglycan teichoic acid transferase TagU [Priestia abyssalis]|uniref:polyisoprenyl-teichoic acid--peptidoglycan teichoic acid transferase TagU n=1 Tax=Priestia abyssalis TaxID=1221450 RepID=UPI0009949C06|nr:LytR family transcriptional regulator [Priestia abyssalis]